MMICYYYRLENRLGRRRRFKRRLSWCYHQQLPQSLEQVKYLELEEAKIGIKPPDSALCRPAAECRIFSPNMAIVTRELVS
jgi:hypothetical protein